MGPGRDGYGAALDAETLADIGYLEAMREEFREWDIHEVPFGYLAVPAGTPVVRSSTPGGLSVKLRRLAEPEDEPT